MRCLVTGGTGFLGSLVAKRLVADGHEAVCYDYAPDHSAVADVAEEVSVVQGDVRETETLVDTLDRYDVDSVVHTAALLRSVSAARPTLAVDVNCVGTTSLLELARISGVDRVVLASSIAVYGYGEPGEAVHVTERSPRRPTNVYGSCKVLAEDVGRHYATEHGMTVVALRFGTVYGPGQSRGSSAFKSRLFEGPLDGESVTLRGASMRPNWLYVRDAVESVALALSVDDGAFNAVNVHSEVASLSEAAAAVREELPDAAITLREEPPASRPGEWAVMDISKASELLGYQPTYDLRAGTRDYVRTVRDRTDA